MNMISNKKILLSILALILSGSLAQFAVAQNADPLKILMITGGGPWHDYNTQKDQIKEGLLERLSNIEITTDYEGADTLTMESTDFQFSRHLEDDWAAEFDVVIYNQCNLQVKDGAYVKGIIAEHVKHQVPAVMLHCPIHLYQYAEGDAAAEWWDFTGAVSYVHEKEDHPNTAPYTIEVLEPQHPIMKNYPLSWRTPAGELYLIVDMHDNATPLSHAYSVETESYSETAWVHEYKGVRVFTSSLGHHNVSMGSDVNLNLVASGVLWAAGKLDQDGSPAPGYEGERGLGWISLWDDTLNGWIESGGVMDWTAPSWYGGETVWPTVDNASAGESFRLDGDTLMVEGSQRNLFYDGRIAGGKFKNFEFKVDVYTSPGSASGVYFHTHYEEDGTPAFGYEAQINASRAGESKTGSLIGASEVKTAAHGDNEWFSGSLRRGTIGLESVGSDSRVNFRNPMIRLLPD
jgi:type 1 glutamine amidotransferase